MKQVTIRTFVDRNGIPLRKPELIVDGQVVATLENVRKVTRVFDPTSVGITTVEFIAHIDELVLDETSSDPVEAFKRQGLDRT